MKVKVTREGFYDLKRRKVGEVIILHDPKLFSKTWMEEMGSKPKSKSKKKDEEILDEDVSLDEDVI